VTKRLFLVSILFLLITNNGCIEHTFNLSVKPEGSVDINYHAKGDPMDFDDSGHLLPDSSIWSQKNWVEKTDDGEVHHLEASFTIDIYSDLNKSLDWKRTALDTVYLRHSFNLEKHDGLFGTNWIFTGVLYSRCFSETYGDIWDYVPEECRVLEDDELMKHLSTAEIKTLEEKFAVGVIQWNIGRYVKLFDRVWQSAASRQPALQNTSETTLSIARAGWVEDMHIYLNDLDIENPNTMNLEWWDDLRPVFLGRLIDITGPGNVELFKSVSNALEREYQISKDIEDDNYRFNLELPGSPSSTNGTENEEGSFSWEFTGKELQNDDGIMIAVSFEFSVWRTIFITFIVMLTLNVVRGIVKKLLRNRQNES